LQEISRRKPVLKNRTAPRDNQAIVPLVTRRYDVPAQIRYCGRAVLSLGEPPMEQPTSDRGIRDVLRSSVLGDTLTPASVREPLVHPSATALQELPKDDAAEVALSRGENLLGNGYYGAALRELAAVKPGDSGLADRYSFLLQDKLARANLGIADRYFIRGDTGNARRFYQRALQVEPTIPALRTIVATASTAFDGLVNQRTALISGMQESIRRGSFDTWCGQKKSLHDLTILEVAEIRRSVAPDFRLEPIFGERPPITPSPGYLDPLAPEADFIDFSSAVPGAIFKGGADASLGSSAPAAVSAPAVSAAVLAPPGDRVPASLAMLVIASVLIAKGRLFAIDQGLDVQGRAADTVPLFRYEYLRDKAKETIAAIQQVESRMLPIQFALDDFAQVVDAIRRPLAEQKAELEAVKQRINELTTQLAALVQAKKAVDQTIIALQPAVDQCDCDWWCFLTAGFFFAVGVALTILAALAFPEDAVILPVLVAYLGSLLSAAAFVAIIETGSCQGVVEVSNKLQTVQHGLQQGISENQTELTSALALRDVLIAKINALEDELSAVYQSNAARVLDAKTLDLIQAQFNSIRQSLLTRAQATAALAEDAFNFERDTEVNLIRDAYFDKDRKDYSAAETLLRDLGGLDHIDVIGRTQKAMQLSHTVSLRRHYPMNFTTLRLAGGARFTTALAEFDRWFPGTYLQRIKEIRVDVLIDGQPAPVRGYLSNDGVSMVRFQDSDNKRPVDGVHVFAEPDPDLGKLCYKRLQRRRHVDTMAFPDLGSYLHEDRMRKLQDRERNFFENVGLESSWIIQLLPDQPVEFSKITDVLIHFQYEAFFDENLKRILEAKRYTDRRESGAFSVKQLVTGEGHLVNFESTLSFAVPVERLEAPALARKIVDVGFVVRPKRAPHLNGVAQLDVSYNGAAPTQVGTNATGIVATAPDHPAGTGLTALETMVRGKSLEKPWTMKIAALPAGLSPDAIDDVVLLVNYEYGT
jgi:hypothetical protein